MSSPAQLLALAEDLKFKEGAGRRAAISRAYYAAFHALQDAVSPMIHDDDLGKNGCAKHGAVLRSLRTWASDHPDQRMRMSLGADARKAYNRLQDCLSERERADYQMGVSGEVSAMQAVSVIGKARRVIEFAAKAGPR